MSAFASTDREYARKWTAVETRCKTHADHEIIALLMVGESDLPMPLGMPRPHLAEDGAFLETKSDAAWPPSAEAEFERWIKTVCGTFGWPKRPLNAVELWNEPWEDDGKCTHDEPLYVNVIPKRTIAVDGKLDDWAGVLPQPMGSQGIGANPTEKAWLPFNKLDDSTVAGSTIAYAAYDQDHFYIAARVADTTPDPGMQRFEKRDDDKFFYPDTLFRLDKSKSFGK